MHIRIFDFVLKNIQIFRDATKTDYTYAYCCHFINPFKDWVTFDWIVPNMSRKSLLSVGNSSHTLNTLRLTGRVGRDTFFSRNSTFETIDSVIPNNLKYLNKKYLLICILVLLLALIGLLAFLMSQYYSSRLLCNSEGLSFDFPLHNVIYRMKKELKFVEEDLKIFNNNTKLDCNHKYNELNNKVDRIEDLLMNALKNCCKTKE